MSANSLGVQRALRASALVIAIAAVFDPAFTRERSDRATVALVSSAQSDTARVAAIGRALHRDFDVVNGPFGAGDATVVIGDALPKEAATLPAPAFAVRRSARTPSATVERLQSPSQVPAGSRATVTADLRVRGARGHTLGASLRADGVVVDTALRRITADDTVIAVDFDLPVVSRAAAPIRVEAGFAGTPAADSAFADGVLQVAANPWRVLVYDARASWASTFVRRALERDERFAVASRIATSRGVTTTSGTRASAGALGAGAGAGAGGGAAGGALAAGGAGLPTGAQLDAYALIVVGAPDALSAAEVAALERFLRARGGAVILLLDSPDAGPWQRLAGDATWRERDGGETLVVSSGVRDSLPLRAAELMWPARLPAGATPVAFTSASARDSLRRPVIWRTPVGAGQLIVSGALDAWRFRDAAQSSFDDFWRDAAARAAMGVAPAISVTMADQLVTPGALIAIDATIRDLAIAAASSAGPVTSARAVVTANFAGEPISFLPGAGVGTLTGTVRAPAQPGLYSITVVTGADSASLPLIVREKARAPLGPRASLDSWIAASSGRSFDDDQLGELTGALKSAIRPAAHTEPWHPMRSPWWILPFVLLLSAEWWLRRRSGQR